MRRPIAIRRSVSSSVLLTIDCSCLNFQSPWLLQLTFCWPPKDTLFLSQVGLELCSQTHFPSPSLLSYLHLDDWCSALASGYLPRSVYSPPPGFSCSTR